jgi:hypothetical protein
MESIILVLIIAILMILAIYASLKNRQLLNKYWLRSCTGKEWKQQFPNVSSGDIRNFLEAFTAAFGFARKERLKFNPSDKVMDVYKAIYPSNWIPDELELETFAKELQKNYAVDLYKVTNNNITLGELFEMTRKASQQ